MTPDEVRQIIREELWFMMKGNDKLNFSLPIQIADGRNISVGKTTGTIIGTETTQKLGLWGTTPVVQPTAIADLSGSGADIDGTARTGVNDILAKLRAVGIIAT